MSSEITHEEFERTEAKWREYKDLHCPDPDHPPSNHHWSWKKKVADADSTVYQFLSLEYAGEIEGLAMLSLVPVESRRPELAGQYVLYVEYLETAPWNQKAYAGKNARYWGVGTSLISAAIDVSDLYGCEGRLALLSLDEAKGFYLDQGFDNMGHDDAESLDYFELSGKALGEQEQE